MNVIRRITSKNFENSDLFSDVGKINVDWDASAENASIPLKSICLFVFGFYGPVRQSIGVTSTAVNLPNHSFTGQA